MKMNVKDGLVGQCAVVLQDVVVRATRDLHDGTAQARKHPAKRRGAVVAERIESLCRLFWNHQGVPPGERANVEKGQNVVVFVDFVTGQLAAKNLAEDSVCHEGAGA